MSSPCRCLGGHKVVTFPSHPWYPIVLFSSQHLSVILCFSLAVYCLSPLTRKPAPWEYGFVFLVHPQDVERSLVYTHHLLNTYCWNEGVPVSLIYQWLAKGLTMGGTSTNFCWTQVHWFPICEINRRASELRASWEWLWRLVRFNEYKTRQH